MPASPRSTRAPTASRRWTWSAGSSARTAAARFRALFEVIGEEIADGQGGRRSCRRWRRARIGGRRPAARDHVAGAERHGQSRQCGRGRLSLHGADGPRHPRLDVAEDGAGARARSPPTARRDRGFHEAKLVTARFFAEREMSAGERACGARSKPARKRDGAAGGGVLADGLLLDVPGPQHLTSLLFSFFGARRQVESVGELEAELARLGPADRADDRARRRRCRW